MDRDLGDVDSKECAVVEATDAEIRSVRESNAVTTVHRWVAELATLVIEADVCSGLLPHHVQLIAIAGAMGAGVFVTIGGPLASAGPLGLLIGMGIWCTAIYVSSAR